MRAAISDVAELGRVPARSIRIYLASRGWQQGERSLSGSWSIGEGDNQYEVLPPSSDRVPDFATRVGETLRTLALVEDRSEIDIIRDLFQARYDVLRHRLDFAGPSGTAPLAEATTAFRAAQSALVSAAATIELPDRPVLPTRPPTRAASLNRRALAGPVSEGSFVFSIWIPVPPKLKPEEDLILFELDEDDPFERLATLRFRDSLTALGEAVDEVESGHADLAAFTSRISKGITAGFCEAIGEVVTESRIGLETTFSWAIDRPVRQSPEPVRIRPGSAEVLFEAGREIRNMVPDEIVRVVGNVVRLHRDSEQGAGDVTIAGIFEGDADERLRRVTLSLSEADYELALRAHGQFELVQVAGAVERRGNRLHLKEASGFTAGPGA